MRKDADHIGAWRRASLLAVMAGTAVLAVACSGGSSTGSGGFTGPSGPAAGSSRVAAPAASQKDLLAFSRCMRSHGVKNFADPNSPGVLGASGINGNSPAVQAAIKACQHLLPSGGIPPAQPGVGGAGSSISG